MKNITIEQLSMYLPYDLNSYQLFTNGKNKVPLHRAIDAGNIIGFTNGDTLSKPIMRPLSDLFKPIGDFSVSKLITHGYHNTFWDKDNFKVDLIYYHDLKILLRYHFDVFGLIEQGLAIDINTICTT